MTGRRVIPIGWSIGQACAWLTQEADVNGGFVTARFNWVEVVARPGLKPAELAALYAEAAVRRLTSTADLDTPQASPVVRAATAAFQRRVQALRPQLREVAG
jgi:hypothetical protein